MNVNFRRQSWDYTFINYRSRSWIQIKSFDISALILTILSSVCLPQIYESALVNCWSAPLIFYLDTLFITVAYKPGMWALLFQACVHLCRGYIKNSDAHRNSRETAWTQHIAAPSPMSQKSHETPDLRRQLSSGSIHRTWTHFTSFLHSDAACLERNLIK